MQHLLLECTRKGYPAEYLLSRIRGRMRRSGTDTSGRGVESITFHADDGLIWEKAFDERKWIYQQMESDLRRAVAPLLFFFEVRTLVLSLRILEMEEPDKMSVNLDKGLLSRDLQNIFRSTASPGEIVGRLEKFLKGSPLYLDGLASAYNEGGVQGCEEMIRGTLLDKAPIICIHPAVIDLFRSLVDMQNTLALAKGLRWEIQEVPRLLKGGHILVRKSDLKPSEPVVKKMVRRLTGGLEAASGDLHPTRLEPLLQVQFSRRMARRMRSGDPVISCVGYLWHIYNVARGRSSRFHAARFKENFAGSLETVQ